MSTPSDTEPPTRPEGSELWAPPYSSGGPPEAPPTTGRRDGMGIAALVMGVVALLGSPGVVPGVLFGLLAVIFGVIGRGRVRRGEAVYRGVATAGVVLGAIALLVAVVAGVLAAIYLPRLTTAVTRPAATVQQCVAQAGGDRTAIRQCRQQLGRQARPGARRPPATPAPPSAPAGT